MKILKDNLKAITSVLVFSFFVLVWSDLIYPLFTNSGTVGNGILVIGLGLFWGWCAGYSVGVFIKLKNSIKIILISSSPLWLIASIYFNSEAYYRNIGTWLRDISNWQINIYFFDWGGWMVFSSIGLFIMTYALQSFLVVNYFAKGKKFSH